MHYKHLIRVQLHATLYFDHRFKNIDFYEYYFSYSYINFRLVTSGFRKEVVIWIYLRTKFVLVLYGYGRVFL